MRIKGLKKSIKSLVLSLCLISFGTIHAQESKCGLMGFVGLSRPILDNGWGVQGGLHVNRYLRDWVELGSQLSYQRTNINHAFLSGKESRMNSILLLAGGRFYMIPKTKGIRAYLNFLIGGMCINERKDGFTRNEFGLGLSTGVYLQFQRMVLGLSAETDQFVLLKIGYRF